MNIYFDHASTTPILPEVANLIHEEMLETNGNPSSTHKYGRIARTKIEQARKSIAESLGAGTGEIFFTSCATEANNMILRRSITDLGVERIISSPIEHHCILHTLEELSEEVEVILLEVDPKGNINLEQLYTLCDSSKKTLVSLMHVNNELGNKLDLEEVSSKCAEFDVYFHTDAAQSMAKHRFNLGESNIHFLTASGHKFHAPKGVGLMYVEGGIILKPWLTGGSQERNMRSGTENIHGIMGMAKALELADAEMENKLEKLASIKQKMITGLQALDPDIEFNGDVDQSSPHILSASFPSNAKIDMLDLLLDMKGVMVSGGSACNSGSVKASHVLEAIGARPDRKAIRFSFSHINSEAEVDQVLSTLQDILANG